MKRYLFVDTETTGLPFDYDLPVQFSDNWPRMVQVGFMLVNEDRSIVEEGSMIIKPDGYTLPTAASDIHQITTRMARRQGVSLELALMKIELLASEADYLVGHNIDFDQCIIDAEFHRVMHKTCLEHLPSYCTMLESAEYCGLGSHGNKWPRLEELYEVLFDESFEGAHDAMADIRATERCFWELVDRGVICLEKDLPQHPAPSQNSSKSDPQISPSLNAESIGCFTVILIIFCLILLFQFI